MDSKTLQSFLERRVGRPVRLRVNNNVHNLLSVVRPRGLPVRISVHTIFLEAPRSVHEALVDFVLGPSAASRREIRKHIGLSNALLSTTPAHKTVHRVETVGRHYDLREIYDRLNARYFQGKVDVQITWGRRPPRPPRTLSHVELGNYSERQRLIRVHPILDAAIVPQFYIDYIVYHEMVHAAVPAEVDAAGRICHHTRKFYALEKKFREYERAVRWQAQNLDRLIGHYCSRPQRRRVQQMHLF